MFGATTFLGQYFQTARGYSPTAAGLLTIPLVAGMLVSSVGSGQLISRFGKWKPFIVTGSVLLVVGFGLLGSIDHATELWLVGIFIAVVGLGTGMLMQNLVLAVQNTVSVQNIGAASSTVAFFRTFGGAIGVSVLGSVLATRVAENSASGLAALGVPAGSSSGGGSLDFASLPAPVAAVIRTAYGDATGRIFLIAGAVALVTVLAVLFIPNRPLRTTIDLKAESASAVQPDAQGTPDVDAVAVPTATTTVPTATTVRPAPDEALPGESRHDAGSAPSGRHEAAAGQAPFDGLSTDARDRLLSLLLPRPTETLEALEEAEALRAEVAELQQRLDAKMLGFDAACERLRRLGLSEDQIARVLGDVHVPDDAGRYATN